MAAVDSASPATVTVTGVCGLAGELVISIAGELDMSNVEIARGQVDTLLASDHSSLVVDLSELSFMDSSGIALLVTVASRGKAISLRHVPELIERVLVATGLTDVLVVER